MPFLHVGLDHLFAAVPEPWGSGGAHRSDGFAYRQFTGQPDGLPRTEITVGPAGDAMLRAYRRSLVTLLRHGSRLAIDELLLRPQDGADYARLLRPFDVQYVLLTASADVLEARGAARGYRAGFGRWSMAAAAHLPRPYDTTFTSGERGPADLAAELSSGW